MSSLPPRPGIVFVPHTHWDREWYEPFQVFRYRLVNALDIVLDMAEEHPDFRFTLDGQTRAIEDYLEIRPENRARVRSAVNRGQLSIGPWLILLDEFLCTGETIVRNLQLGTRAAAALGGAMHVGYLPDMFGHIAQMPQILSRAGLQHSALWRGVPGRVSEHAFRWVAPDGSSVRVEYLFDGYGNGLDVLLVPDRITEAIREYADATQERWGSDPVLGMVGTDHMPPQRQLMRWATQHSTPEFPIRVASLEEYITTHANDIPQETVVGELRSHARGNILPGVLSIRRPLKRAMATAERTIGEAERVAATFSRDDFTPFLDLAWRAIIDSTAHDSVVGSGTDDTVEQVHARLAEAAHTARAVRDGILERLATTVGRDAYVAVNTLPRARAVPVEVEYAGAGADGDLVAITSDGERLPVQRLTVPADVLGDETMDAADVARVLRRIHRRELFGQEIDRVTITPGHLVFHVAEVPTSPDFDILALRRDLAVAVTKTSGTWRVQTLAAPRATVLVTPVVPPSGAATFRLVSTSGPAATLPSDGGVQVSPEVLSNGLVGVEVNPDGTVSVTGEDGTVLHGVGRIVDGGDRGDTYNYGPPAHDLLIEEPTRVRVNVIEQGPLRGAIDIVRTYQIPVGLSDDVDVRHTDTVTTEITTRVELRTGEPFVRMAMTWVNASRDHRTRFHVPLPQRVDTSASEGQFSVTERGLSGEGGWGEYPIPTYPATGFVSAGAASVLLEDASEYEVIGDGTELAITLLRAVGSISVNLHPLRDEPAASEISVPGAQELGQIITTRLAVLPTARGWHDADAVRWAEELRTRSLVIRGSAKKSLMPEPREGIAVHGDHIHVSAIRLVGEWTEIRIVAMSDQPTTAHIRGPFDQIRTVNLLGQPDDHPNGEPAPGGVTVSLDPWEIRTIHVRATTDHLLDPAKAAQ